MMLTGHTVSSEPTIALERWLGDTVLSCDRVPLTHLPTRVHPLHQWSRSLGAEVWVKRDDETNALYGGNKPRKLEFLLGNAIRGGYKSVLTFGGLGSHHALATTLFARELGLQTILGLVYQPITPAVRENLLYLHALGAQLIYGKGPLAMALASLREVVRRLVQSDMPYIIPTGGSSPLGTLGYVNAGLELAEQLRRGELPVPRVIFVPLGSGGTLAGLVLAAKLAKLPSKVVGVLVTDIFPPTRARVLRLVRRTGRLLGPRGTVAAAQCREADFAIETRFVGRGYGASIREANELSAWLRDREGIELEGTYTAKAAYALQCGVREGRWGSGPFLFWLTFAGSRIASRLQPLPDWRELPPVFHEFFASEAGGRLR